MTEDAQPTEPISEHEPSEITYSEQFYPARPRALRPRARLRPQGSPQHGEDRSGEPVGTNPFYVAWLQRSSMLHDANTLANQFSGTGGMWQNPYANPNPESAIRAAGGLVHRLPAVAGDQARPLVPRHPGRPGPVAQLRAHRHQRPAHRAGQARRRPLGLAAHPQRGRPLRPDQHRDRQRVRHRGRLPHDVRDRLDPRRHDHRRHRARPHRQGRRLPARRDELRRLPRHLPHGRHRARRTGPCCPTSPRAATRST